MTLKTAFLALFKQCRFCIRKRVRSTASPSLVTLTATSSSTEAHSKHNYLAAPHRTTRDHIRGTLSTRIRGTSAYPRLRYFRAGLTTRHSLWLTMDHLPTHSTSCAHRYRHTDQPSPLPFLSLRLNTDPNELHSLFELALMGRGHKLQLAPFSLNSRGSFCSDFYTVLAMTSDCPRRRALEISSSSLDHPTRQWSPAPTCPRYPSLPPPSPFTLDPFQSPETRRPRKAAPSLYRDYDASAPVTSSLASASHFQQAKSQTLRHG